MTAQCWTHFVLCGELLNTLYFCLHTIIATLVVAHRRLARAAAAARQCRRSTCQFIQQQYQAGQYHYISQKLKGHKAVKIQRDRERHRDIHTQTETERQRQTHTETETERDTHRDTETESCVRACVCACDLQDILI